MLSKSVAREKETEKRETERLLQANRPLPDAQRDVLRSLCCKVNNFKR